MTKQQMINEGLQVVRDIHSLKAQAKFFAQQKGITVRNLDEVFNKVLDQIKPMQDQLNMRNDKVTIENAYTYMMEDAYALYRGLRQRFEALQEKVANL